MFALRFTEQADGVLSDMERDGHPKLDKVRRTLARIENNPRHPGLQSHRWKSVTGPNGEELWESYVENRTPSAWRIWWYYGPENRQITIVTLGEHP